MRLPYKPGDDDLTVAAEYISKNLDNPGPWPTLLSDEYVEQTYRVLKGLIERAKSAYVKRKSQQAQLHADYSAGHVPVEEYKRAGEEYADWKIRARRFDDLLAERRRLASAAVRRVRGDDYEEELLDVLVALAVAVDDHRQSTPEERDPSSTDRALWARLAVLSVPSRRMDKRYTLANMVTEARRHAGE